MNDNSPIGLHVRYIICLGSTKRSEMHLTVHYSTVLSDPMMHRSTLLVRPAVLQLSPVVLDMERRDVADLKTRR